MRFDTEAKNWDKLERRQKLANSVCEYVKNNISKNDTLMDFGCGTGLVGICLAKYVQEVVGIDVSKEMINQFNHKVKHLDNVIGICEDVNNVNKKFDVIVSSMTFHHIENIKDMLGILADKLNKNGKFFIADLVSEDGSFHDKGNEDVFHLGFEKSDFESEYFDIVEFKVIHSVKKHKKFDVFIVYLKKR